MARVEKIVTQVARALGILNDLTKTSFKNKSQLEEAIQHLIEAQIGLVFLDLWITDRPPTDTDTCEESGNCVEATYANGMTGWEPVSSMRSWSVEADKSILAWRRIRPPYKPAK